VKKILIVSRKGKSRDLLIQMLETESGAQVETACSEEEATERMERNEFDLVIINSPLEGNSGVDFAAFAAEKYAAGVLLVVQNKYANLVSQKLDPYGVLVVGKPVVRAFFNQALKFAEVAAHRVSSLKEENINLHQKLEELKLINRAKCVLIQYLSMSELQAHKYIEKQAMDMRLTRAQVARQILKAYEQDGFSL
jgi:response regulator NasT